MASSKMGGVDRAVDHNEMRIDSVGFKAIPFLRPNLPAPFELFTMPLKLDSEHMHTIDSCPYAQQPQTIVKPQEIHPATNMRIKGVQRRRS